MLPLRFQQRENLTRLSVFRYFLAEKNGEAARLDSEALASNLNSALSFKKRILSFRELAFELPERAQTFQSSPSKKDRHERPDESVSQP